jgi:hypothetical protein
VYDESNLYRHLPGEQVIHFHILFRENISLRISSLGMNLRDSFLVNVSSFLTLQVWFYLCLQTDEPTAEV